MTMSDTLLFNDPKVKMLAMEAIEESIDFQAFGRRMLELLTNSLISARADEACGAEYKERSPERTNCRNGYRNRRLVTSVGDIELRIPKLRSGTFFPEDLIERYCRIDRALVAAVAEMYVSGVSTRKVESVARRSASGRCRSPRSPGCARASTPRSPRSAAGASTGSGSRTCGSTRPTSSAAWAARPSRRRSSRR